MLLFSIWTFAFLVPCCLSLHNLRYSDLEEMGAECPPRDTCAVSSRRSFYASNCECDSQCQVFDDCCIDANLRTSVTPLDGMTCVQDGANPRGAYAISRCQSGWRGPAQVRQRCENLHDLSDPLVAAPVTDSQNGMTYRNRYCAECNGADPEHLQSWVIAVSCQSLSSANSTGNITGDYVRDRMVYRTTPPHRNKWGVYYWDDELERDKFYPCELSFWLPSYLHQSVRMCRPNIISTCAPNWRQNSVRRKCAAYVAVVYIDKKVYRNPHCATCNNADMSSLVCSLGIQQRTKPPMSFTLLLDVNLSDGNRVGEVSRCSGGQKYDSFFKKCRRLVCALPGYVMRGDRCVRS